VSTVSKPLWQQVTALVSLSAGGAITGLSFVPRVPAEMSSPSGLPLRLAALQQMAEPSPAPAQVTAADDVTLRTAIVNVAKYYLQLAKDKSPAQMEALIWQQDSLDGADHGPSCAAFASLTLELGSQVVGQQSWVTGGTSYPWPLHKWADVRVDPNPDSLDITSVLQDAQAHQRWHPLGDGYQPEPGDWVLFDGHVEVVTGYSGGVLYTIGGDSLPNYSVNAHEYSGSLAAQGVAGFVDNGNLVSSSGAPAASQQTPPGARSSHDGQPASSGQSAGGGTSPAIPGVAAPPSAASSASPSPSAPSPAPPADAGPPSHRTGSPGQSGAAAIPGTSDPAPIPGANPQQRQSSHSPAGASSAAPGHAGSAAHAGTPAPARPASGAAAAAAIPGVSSAAQPSASGPAASPPATQPSKAAAPSAGPEPSIPGLPASAQPSPAPGAGQHEPAATSPPEQHAPPAAAAAGETSAQQAFIAAVAPGAIATQRSYDIPASVTIAQAILESGWGQSYLAAKDHNLFGIKGRGPGGSDALPTQEYVDGHFVNTVALFRVYDNFAQSIEDHGQLLATSGYYKRAMAVDQNPDAFANALTGVYATDPGYGAKLISLMQEFDLYQYDTTAASAPAPAPTAPAARSSASPARTPTPTSRVPASSVPASPAPPSRTPASRAPASPAPAARTTSARSTSARTASTRSSVSRTPVSRTQVSRSPVTRASASRTRPVVSSPAPIVATAMYRPVMPAPIRASEAAALRTTTASTLRRTASAARRTRAGVPYLHQIPLPVKNSFIALAKVPLTGAEELYRDVAVLAGISWELLAACDWMQCRARPRFSPVHGEKLGTPNPDGTVYHTKSEALEQCAYDLVELARAVYRIDLTDTAQLSVRDLAKAFAAFRWGGLLARHHTSAMEFPYSVAGLTDQHLAMRWPAIDEPNTPDRPGARFRLPFGAVPIVIGLSYPATAA
jgi:flagellum-specific peptidoglycan hydrolase FlgJ